MKTTTQAKAVIVAHDRAIETKDNTALSDGARRQVEVIVNGLNYGLGHLNKIDVEDFKAKVKRLGG